MNKTELELINQKLKNFFQTLKTPSKAQSEIIKGTVSNPTTRFDIEMNERISACLLENSPYPVISEEAVLSCPPHADMFWLIDPIDGSREFAQGLPECVSSLALIHASTGRPTYAVIHDIYQGITFSTLDKPNISRPRLKADNPVLLWSRSESALGLAKYLEGMAEFFSEIELFGSIAYKLLKCALSPLEIMTISLQPKSKWDLAGAAAFVNNAPELLLTDLQGREISYSGPMTELVSGVVCCRRAIHAEVLKALDVTGATRLENLRKSR